jgi:hypothetical protein
MERQKLWIRWRRITAICIKPSLGVSNWPIILLHQQTQSSFLASSSPRHQQVFLAPLPGKKKTSARGVSHAHPLLCFKFSFTLFLLASFYQKHTQKLVPTIVVISVGLLLSWFIMLSINGWFL